jgi:hypothetical protein
MRRRSGFSALIVLALGWGTAAKAAPRDAGAPRTNTAANPHGAAPAASASTADNGSGDPHAGLGLPPGHPAVADPDSHSDDDDATDEGLPPGHPPTQPAPQAQAPAAAQARLPEDRSEVDTALPPGVIVIEVRDGSDKPLPRANVTMGILQQSVAKGESRRRVARQSDENGDVRFDGLETGTGIAYRITIPWGDDEPATYAAMPFQLDLHAGQRVRVHVYPVTHQINEALIGMEGILYVELRDDALQFDEFFRVYNVGSTTWVPRQVTVTLPRGYKAFNTEREMSDTGFDEVPGEGAKLRGTFGPGRNDTHFRYQLPYEGGDSVDFTLTLPPHVAQMRIIAEASKTMTLRADGFGTATPDRNQRGQRVLVTERRVRNGEAALARVHIGLDNIPTEGSAKWIASGIAAATIALGIYLATQQTGSKKKERDPHESERARSRLVAEIAALERARQSGDVGPSAYARIHAALIDALARILPMETSGERNAPG